MASDGCQPIGRPVYPVYGMRSFTNPHNEVVDSSPALVRSEPQRGTAKTGTWDGPAPIGSVAPVPVDEITAITRPKPGPTDVLLKNDVRMPLLGFGTKAATAASVKEAIDLGYKHFDCSPDYGNQVEIGKVFQSTSRSQLFISSKLPNQDHCEAYEACRRTLQELGVDFLDLYVISWPVAWKKGTQDADTEITLQETWAQMENLVEDGLVKNIGLANFSLPQVEQILGSCKIRPTVLQIELHPMCAQRKMVGVCKRYGIQIAAHHPLGGAEVDNLKAEVVAKVASECKQSPAQVALRWSVQRMITVIVEAASTDEAKDFVGVNFFGLTNDEKRQLDTMDQNKRCYQPEWAVFADPEAGGATKPSVVFGY